MTTKEDRMIKGLHHNAYRCKDSEETRKFYEDFLGLPLAHTLEIGESKSGRKTSALHTFYELDDFKLAQDFEYKTKYPTEAVRFGLTVVRMTPVGDSGVTGVGKLRRRFLEIKGLVGN